MPSGPGCRSLTPGAVRGFRGGGSAPLRGLTRIGNPPYGTAGIFRNQQRPVLIDGNADRAAPDLRIVDHEAAGEILIFARRRTVPHRHAYDLVAGAFGAIPGAMLGSKDVAA